MLHAKLDALIRANSPALPLIAEHEHSRDLRSSIEVRELERGVVEHGWGADSAEDHRCEEAVVSG